MGACVCVRGDEREGGGSRSIRRWSRHGGAPNIRSAPKERKKKYILSNSREKVGETSSASITNLIKNRLDIFKLKSGKKILSFRKSMKDGESFPTRFHLVFAGWFLTQTPKSSYLGVFLQALPDVFEGDSKRNMLR